MTTPLTEAEQGYLQGLAEYEAALIEQSATAGGGGEHEAAYLQGQIDYEHALIAQMEQESAHAGLEAAYLAGLENHHAGVAGEGGLAGMSAEEAFVLGMMECEAALGAQGQELSPELKKEASYQLGVRHAEVAQLDAMLGSEAEQLEGEDREAYEQGRRDYQAALEQEKNAESAGEPTESASRSRTPRKRGRRT